ncbi:MAG: M48 family metallopeptidase [Flavobacteriales bacterium]|nr:M48 family metallopeptidase [Flavobacteriales bacterium]
MKKIFSFIVIATLVVACTTNPMTGRKSFQGLADNSQLMTASFQQYQQVKQESKIITGTPEAEMIKRVGNRIKTVAEAYYKSIGQEAVLNGFEWEFILIDDSKTVNAWCMPGGKVAFFTGILPICKDETGIATVMGHEVAHALAGHGAERMSQSAGAQLLGDVIGGSISNSNTKSLFEQFYPMGASLTILSYSRKQELDADLMGLYLMAMAGYNPEKAPELWERMKAQEGNDQRPPDFLSTHPNPDTRILDMQKNMAKARQYYNQSIYRTK